MLGTCFAQAGWAAEVGHQRPNIVFIHMDDLGWKDVGCMGSQYYHTPHIDRLAAEGMIFTNAYACGPNCAPSRASLMTGLYTPRNGIYTVGSTDRGPREFQALLTPPNRGALTTGTLTMAELLQPAGYTTGCIGKWHLGKGPGEDPASQGFDFTACIADGVRSYFAPSGTSDDPDSPQGQYIADRITDRAISFLEDSQSKPFFLYLANYSVHSPWEAVPGITEKYQNKPPAGGQGNAIYASMIERADRNIGRLLEALQRLELEKNTLVVFFSDNGGVGRMTSMAPLRGTKGMLYEGGIRVPAILRWPGVIPAGTKCATPIIGVDFLPTFLEMAGMARPSHLPLDGLSLLPLLRSQEGSALATRPIFWHFPAYLPGANTTGAKNPRLRGVPCGAVRQGPWKLIEFFDDGSLELYNLAEDIGEQRNLATQLPEKTKDLHRLMIEWRQSLQAPVPVEKNPLFNPDSTPDSKRSSSD